MLPFIFLKKKLTIKSKVNIWDDIADDLKFYRFDVILKV